MTNLESLANELLLDLFEYLDTVHLFRAFHGLNSRFDSLLFDLFQAYRLDLRFASKHDFDILCDKYISQIGHQTIALRLSNDDDTPQQIELFLFRDDLLSYFTRLKALSLYNIISEETMSTICLELGNLPTLTHLSIVECALPCYFMGFSVFINCVWYLPKLVYCNLGFNYQGEEHFESPSEISSSIKYVSIRGIQFDFDQINRLLEQTPNLRYLAAHNTCLTDDIDSTSIVSSLITLNLSFMTMNENSITNFLQNMLNLRHLAVDIYGVCVNGYQWENIIQSYLPNLKIFRLREQIPILDQNQGDQELDALLTSFQSQFWLVQRQWFIRCDWNMTGTYSFISLYTLPYSFSDFAINCVLQSRSTCTQNNSDESYHRVRKLHYNTCPLDDTSLLRFQFFNLHDLSIEATIHDQFCSILPRCDQLTIINIFLSDDNTNVFQLQRLLNRATSLRSLTIDSSSSSLMMSFIQNTTISVRRLNLYSDNHWFNGKQCLTLINSPLSVGCEMLTIRIKNCDNAIDCVNNMINLRALRIQYENDEGDFNSLTYRHNDFIAQLYDYLPSTCVVTCSAISIDDIHLWIR
jgi:hypothetical protein